MKPNHRDTTDAEGALFSENPTIASRMPIALPDGTTLSTFSGSCPECHNPIPDDLFRGTLTEAFSVLALDAVGLCTGCSLTVRFRLRFRDDGTCDVVDNAGTWVRRELGREEGRLARCFRAASEKIRVFLRSPERGGKR